MNYENNRTRLRTVEELKEKKAKLISKLKQELDIKDDILHEKSSNFKSEDLQLRVRLENLKKAQSDFHKIIKP